MFKAPMMALTATATKRTQRVIIDSLQLGKYHTFQLFCTSFARRNLFYEVRSKTSIDNDLFYRGYYTDGSTIIYCRKQATCDRISSLLLQNGIANCAAYHGGYDDTKRENIQKAFECGQLQTIISTIAFGMGIDKPNIRYVLHYGVPESLEDFYHILYHFKKDLMVLITNSLHCNT